ncbi:hypothetical protein HPC49_40110 [Pyxidicoccus fallax]|uniref:Outer membrane protein beta-barrel domain-containing protein n=1 Tax=Pyxidicoccus fallax TaxID=394095 RepID=A0A848LUN3_9BACT|nr:hypothetical protein [Pyxidicoccus fallax]NMO21302.1 hypothetical protein [Pyxidicoccus fallax]NPC84405.1 hypothetical protein [Pyxidicoccus fallax]
MTRFSPSRLLVSALLLVSFQTSAAQEPATVDSGEQRVMAVEATEEDRLGAVVAPVTLPSGTTALYGFVGAPELGVGFRQGFGGFEMEARGRLNWFQLSAVLELGARLRVLERGPLTLAPTLGLGVVLNSGATYMDELNFSGVLVRVTPGLVAGYRVADTVTLLGLVDLPVDIGLSEDQARRFQALGGGGVEVYLGSNLSVLLAGQLGLETFRERPGAGETRLGWSTRLGLGARLF